MLDLLIREWNTNNNINLYLLDALTERSLEASVSNGGRSVGQILRHMVEVRNQWLAAIDSRHVGEKLPKAPDIPALVKGFQASASAVVGLLLQLGTPDAKVKGFRSDASAFVSYLCAHDAHHRGQVLLTLRLCGQRVDSKLAYGLWDWRARALAGDPNLK